MTSADESLTNVNIAPRPLSASRQQRWESLDRWSVRISEWLNPILVKETRQALKSKQFLITFALVLICGWSWSILGMALSNRSFGGGETGPRMFFGYFVILSFPLLVIVPFSAYRSLASEWEDNTYELLSISALRPHQIVSGKLGSSLLQTTLYLSAIAPCLAFTYLLRGIDLPTILFLMFWLIVNSISSTLLALCLATLSRAKHWQVIMSVALIAGCLINFSSFGIGFAGECLFSSYRMLYFEQGEFWAACGMILTAAIGYSVMFFLVARASLMFNSENRSTAIRICMVAQYMLFMAWAFWFWLFAFPAYEALAVFAVFIGIHWWVMGMFLIGERPELSQRAKRRLPQSFLGRMFWTTFNPGSGTGYLFVLGNAASAILVLLAAPALFTAIEPTIGARLANRGPNFDFAQLATFTALGFCYMAIYLGFTRLIVLLLRRVTQVTMMLAVLIHILLVLAGTLIPLTIQLSLNTYSNRYSALQMSNFFWTLEEVLDSRSGGFAEPLLLAVLPALAALVIFLNLRSVARELRQSRVAAPQRVRQEDEELHPTPAEPQYVSPWDDEPPTANMG